MSGTPVPHPLDPRMVKMTHSLLFSRQLSCLIAIITVYSKASWKAMQILIRWLRQKPADLDLHCFPLKVISRFHRTRFKGYKSWKCMRGSGPPTPWKITCFIGFYRNNHLNPHWKKFDPLPLHKILDPLWNLKNIVLP